MAKSGRTTGLTCASISALNLNVEVAYYKNCDETTPYLINGSNFKTYTNQIAIEGSEFSDAGDSGSLVVDASNAEPVGLFFAGGLTNAGVSEGVANPAPTVLQELGSQTGSSYTFVGTTDHPVSCLNYGAATATAAQGVTLAGPQLELAQQALAQARMLINPTLGILGVATGKSSDHAGEAAVILYVDESMNVSVPQTVDGVRTEVIPTTARAVACGYSAAVCRKVRRVDASGVRGVQPGGCSQGAGGAELDAAESRVFWRGRGPKPRQSARGIAGHLCRSQTGSGDTAAGHQWPAHTVCHHGPAARNALLSQGAGSFHGALHGSSSHASSEWHGRVTFPQAPGFAAVKESSTQVS